MSLETKSTASRRLRRSSQYRTDQKNIQLQKTIFFHKPWFNINDESIRSKDEIKPNNKETESVNSSNIPALLVGNYNTTEVYHYI
jgi:hypothetical protein